MKRIELEVAGMHCGHCLQAVRQAITSVPTATVESIQIGSATVAIDESRTSVGDLIDAIQDAGYEAQEATA